MNSFPFFTPLEKSILDKIQNVKRSEFSGAAPFVLFTEYNTKDGKTIGTHKSYEYSNRGFERFPPVITNLEIKPTGSMGVIREGSVTIKFASILQLKSYQNFFRIGSAKSIVWGWSKKRNGDPQDASPLNCGEAKKYVDNVSAWQKYCNGADNSKDVIVGPLMDFNISVNDDATVDVIFRIGSKNEIPAFLGNTVKDKDSTTSSSTQEKLDGKISSLFNLKDEEFKKLKSNYNAFRDHFINYGYANRGIVEKGTSLLAEAAGLSYDSTSDSIYIDMEWIVRFAINKNNGGKNSFIVDIDTAIGCAHPYMLSNSENIIFTNEKAANPTKDTEGKLVLDVKNTQNIKHRGKGQTYVQQKKTSWVIDGHAINFETGRWGYIKNIYVKQEFLEELFKTHSNGNSKDVLADLCTEINKASCGLTDLAPQVSSALGKEKMVYTIVDYALVPPNPPEVQTLNLFGADTTITGINFASDLPKEIAAMAMLKNRDQKGREIGKNLFFEYEKDGCDCLGHDESDEKIPIVGGNGVPKDEQGAVDKAAELAKKAWEGLGKLFSIAGEKVENMTGISGVVDENCTIISYKHNDFEFDKPSEASGLLNGFKVALKDTQLLKHLYFGKDNDTNKNNPLLPIELEITTLGISGVTVGKICDIKDLPFNDGKGLLQVVEVNHTVDSALWQTTIKFKYRPGN
jgi:hypothetical protein